MALFDTQLRWQRLARRPTTDTRPLTDLVEVTLRDRLADIKRDLPRVLWIGDWLSAETTTFLRTLKGTRHLTWLATPRTAKPANGVEAFVYGEAACLPVAEASFDVVVASDGLEHIHDLPGALVQIRQALKPDGVFIGALCGGETLFQLREVLLEAEMQATGGVSPRVHPMVDLPTLAGLMQRAGFALPVVDSDVQMVYYRALHGLVHDLRALGCTNTLAGQPRHALTRDFWALAGALYAARFGTDDGLLPASFEVLYAIGWAPDSSQPKPLRPGSAKTRLAEALGTTEQSLGEQTQPQ